MASAVQCERGEADSRQWQQQEEAQIQRGHAAFLMAYSDEAQAVGLTKKSERAKPATKTKPAATPAK